MLMFKKATFLFTMLVLALGLMGCPKKPQKPPEAIEPVTPVEVVQPETAKEEPTIRGKEFQEVPELQAVYYKYESYRLDPESTAVLQKNAEYMKNHAELEFLVEANCCECGTNEYNMGLGQKRAQAVREYYINLGVPASRLATLSYGKEKPSKPNSGPPDSPDCYFNRHTDTKARPLAAK
ncbi:MAG: hypothetical protein A2297_09360 [Elusimicrobia bacterium RIFOXYB2_FULL_48_7]|nr:MAG: hypothetical protein A2297_09360 [Elusimicrobia bacterium RIFOXYB2_FULL_48_7]